MAVEQEVRPPYVTFESRELEDRNATIETGHMTFREVDYAVITPAGSKDQVERVAEDWLKMIDEQSRQGRFPAAWVEHYRLAYRRWKDGQEVPLNGKSLADWPPVTKAFYNTLRQIGIHTVEDLAAANEETIQRLGMGGRALVERAKSYVSTDLSKPEKFHQLEVANKDLTQQVEELTKTVAALQAAQSTQSPQPAKPSVR